MSLTDVLRFSTNAQRDATDPRDQIYGILGLVGASGPDPIVPNYDLSVAGVHAQAMLRMISDAQSLAPLTAAEGQRHEQLQLPSWVPDWTGASYFQPTPYPWEPYSAYPGSKTSWGLLDGSVLRVKGVVVDSVKETTGRMVSEHQRVHELLMRFGQWRLPMSKEGKGLSLSSLDDLFGFESHSDASTAPSPNGVFWRTVLGDALLTEDSHSRRVRPKDARRVVGWWKRFVNGVQNKEISQGEEWSGLKKKVPPEHRGVFYTIRERTRSRLFSTTEKGRCGMGVSIIKGGSFGTEDTVTEVEKGDCRSC